MPNRVGEVINWELCKKLEIDHTTQWYTHKLKSVLKNETHKILWDFEIQTYHLIPAKGTKWSDNKKKLRKNINFNVFFIEPPVFSECIPYSVWKILKYLNESNCSERCCQTMDGR